MVDLMRRSIEIIIQNQNASGAFLASPNFPTYHYCWYRDSAFIAHALDLVGETKSSAGFHEWAARNVNSRAELVERAIENVHQGKQIKGNDILHTRYSVDGENSEEDWPNFQLDGFGTWLWALDEHRRLCNYDLPEDWLHAANLAADYIANLWCHPCSDCWEEFPDEVHTYTLSAIYAGLRANSSLNGADHQQTMESIFQHLTKKAVINGHFIKFEGSDLVDASHLGISTPYRVVAPDDPVMKGTVAEIESTLRHNDGGVHRYVKDTYYGGGEWVHLAAWLGWYYVEVGEHDKAELLMEWVEAQADEQGQFPEQVSTTMNDPNYYEPWRERWGDIANPLLWAHAKYIILKQNIMLD